jgi:hemerythrin
MPELGPQELSTGVREIDADIEGLCFILARIFEPLVECRRRYGECDHRQCTRISAISTYLSRSFARQDGVMEAAAYPLTAEHQLEHDALLDQLVAMQDAGVCGDRDRHIVREAVARWMLRHNRAYDRTLANWAVTRRVLTPEP